MSGEATALPELMTVAEVAELWRQRKETVYRKIARGELRAVRLGDETAALRIPRRELERIYTDAGASFLPSRPPTPAAHVRDPEASGSSHRRGNDDLLDRQRRPGRSHNRRMRDGAAAASVWGGR
jgi:excisionase family DNA binding protein